LIWHSKVDGGIQTDRQDGDSIRLLQESSTQTMFSLCLRWGRRRFAASLCQSVYTERPIPPLVEEVTPLPSSDKGKTHGQKIT
jgi:hypothetical protein